MNKKNKKSILKNYIYIILSLAIIVLIVWYIFSWYQVKEKEKYLESYLITSNTINYETSDFSELNQVLKEAPSKYFVYISYTEDEKVYKLEKKLKDIIDEYNLKDAFYYVNILNIKENENLIESLNDMLFTKNIQNVPCIIYYEDGKVKDIVQDNNIFSHNDLTSLLRKYNFEKISDLND